MTDLAAFVLLGVAATVVDVSMEGALAATVGALVALVIPERKTR